MRAEGQGFGRQYRRLKTGRLRRWHASASTITERRNLSKSKKDTIGNSPIKALFGDLLKLDESLSAAFSAASPPADGEYIPMCERHWALRKQIEATPVTSLADLEWMARTLMLEAERDPEFENQGAGSARSLATTLANGTLQFAGAAQ